MGSRSGPLPGAGPGRRDCSGGSLLRKSTLLVTAAAQSLSNWSSLNSRPSLGSGPRHQISSPVFAQ